MLSSFTHRVSGVGLGLGKRLLSYIPALFLLIRYNINPIDYVFDN